MEDKGTLTTAAAVRALRPFTLDFGCAAAGSDDVVVRLELSNPSQLPLHWELHSYDDPDLEMENWVEPGRPRSEEEKVGDGGGEGPQGWEAEWPGEVPASGV
jgi:hypothetical protein